jgi:hypothetical protein
MFSILHSKEHSLSIFYLNKPFSNQQARPLFEFNCRKFKKVEKQETETRRKNHNASLRYCRIKCTGPEISEYITSSHEAIQCLHHAYLYDINFVCLVIGDRNGNLEAGIFVEFTKELKESYGRKVLQDLYNFGLKWVYKSDIDSDDWPENEIKASLHRLDSPMSYESFERPYGVSNHASKIRCSCPFLVLPGYIRFLSPLGMLQNLGVIH